MAQNKRKQKKRRKQLEENHIRIYTPEELKKEKRFFEFVKRRTNNFEYFLDEYYGFIANHTGRRGVFDQPLRDGEDIEFYFRFKDVQSELNKDRSFISEEKHLRKILDTLSKEQDKELEEKTLEKMINCRLQYIEDNE